MFLIGLERVVTLIKRKCLVNVVVRDSGKGLARNPRPRPALFPNHNSFIFNLALGPVYHSIHPNLFAKHISYHKQ